MPDTKNINDWEPEDLLDLANSEPQEAFAELDALEGLPPGCEEFPAIPLRGMLVFPYSAVHLDVGRAKSIQALDEAMLTGREIFFAMQRMCSRKTQSRRSFTTLAPLPALSRC